MVHPTLSSFAAPLVEVPGRAGGPKSEKTESRSVFPLIPQRPSIEELRRLDRRRAVARLALARDADHAERQRPGCAEGAAGDGVAGRVHGLRAFKERAS